MANRKLDLTIASNVEKAILSLQSKGKKLKDEASIIALACIRHMKEHGDYTLAVKLIDACVDAFGKNMRIAMAEYFLKHTWLAYDEETKKFFKDKSKVKSEDIDLDAIAKGKAWHEMERPAKEVPFDAAKSVKSLLARALKEIKSGGNVDFDALNEMFAMELNEAKSAAAKLKAEEKKKETIA